jgi:hypothetical protein
VPAGVLLRLAMPRRCCVLGVRSPTHVALCPGADASGAGLLAIRCSRLRHVVPAASRERRPALGALGRCSTSMSRSTFARSLRPCCRPIRPRRASIPQSRMSHVPYRALPATGSRHSSTRRRLQRLPLALDHPLEMRGAFPARGQLGAQPVVLGLQGRQVARAAALIASLTQLFEAGHFSRRLVGGRGRALHSRGVATR